MLEYYPDGPAPTMITSNVSGEAIVILKRESRGANLRQIEAGVSSILCRKLLVVWWKG